MVVVIYVHSCKEKVSTLRIHSSRSGHFSFLTVYWRWCRWWDSVKEKRESVKERMKEWKCRTAIVNSLDAELSLEWKWYKPFINSFVLLAFIHQTCQPQCGRLASLLPGLSGTSWFKHPTRRLSTSSTSESKSPRMTVFRETAKGKKKKKRVIAAQMHGWSR